jgi:hypothetical protein
MILSNLGKSVSSSNNEKYIFQHYRETSSTRGPGQFSYQAIESNTVNSRL